MEETKDKICELVNEFYLEENLFSLAEIVIIGKKILKEEKFPLKKYEKYKNK